MFGERSLDLCLLGPDCSHKFTVAGRVARCLRGKGFRVVAVRLRGTNTFASINAIE